MKKKKTGTKTVKVNQSSNLAKKKGCGCGKKTSK